MIDSIAGELYFHSQPLPFVDAKGGQRVAVCSTNSFERRPRTAPNQGEDQASLCENHRLNRKQKVE